MSRIEVDLTREGNGGMVNPMIYDSLWCVNRLSNMSVSYGIMS